MTPDSDRVPVARALDVRWNAGSLSSQHNTDPDIQVYWFDEDTVILRQNKAVDYEAPFMFLVFGRDRALLLDTGATASDRHFPLRRVVDELIQEWHQRQPRANGSYGLLILHTHAHGDHVAGDAQFAGRPDTVLISATLDAARSFLGFSGLTDEPVQLELGERQLSVMTTPGHHATAITLYDPRTGILFTGDTVYRGRLYIDDWAAFERSIELLIQFSISHPVTLVLGCHIEMTTQPGVDYPKFSTYQPDEPPLEMTVEHLYTIRNALRLAGGVPTRTVSDDFILWPQ